MGQEDQWDNGISRPPVSKNKPNISLRHAREAIPLTREELAAKIGVNSRTIARWELEGNIPQPEHIRLLHEVLGKTPQELGFGILDSPNERDQQGAQPCCAQPESGGGPPKREGYQAITTRKAQEQKSLEAHFIPESNGNCLQTTEEPGQDREEDVPLHPLSAFSIEGRNQSTCSDERLVPRIKGGESFLHQQFLFQRWEPFTYLCIIVLFIVTTSSIIAFLRIFQALHPQFSPNQQPETIQSQPCPSSPAGLVIVRTTEVDYCFSGTGTMDFLVEGVTRIETDKYRVSWRYVYKSQEYREPSNTDWHLHVCAGQMVSYSSPIRLTRIHVVPPDAQAKCIHNVQGLFL